MGTINNNKEIKDLYIILGEMDKKIAEVKDSNAWVNGDKSSFAVSDKLVAARQGIFESLCALESLHGKHVEDVEPFEFDLDDLSEQA